jgi:hypothetical protein
MDAIVWLPRNGSAVPLNRYHRTRELLIPKPAIPEVTLRQHLIDLQWPIVLWQVPRAPRCLADIRSAGRRVREDPISAAYDSICAPRKRTSVNTTAAACR